MYVNNSFISRFSLSLPTSYIIIMKWSLYISDPISVVGGKCWKEEFEDIKGIIRIRKSKNRQQKNDKRANNGLQNTTQKT